MIAAVLDSTVLSNFAHIRQARLIEIAFDQPVTVAAVMLELDGGVQSGRVPATDWSWLPVIELDETELADANTLSRALGQGEAQCIALAASRGWLVLTDDRKARTTAQSLGVVVSGTLGTLANLVRGKATTLAEADTLLLQMMRHGYRSPVQTLSELLDGS